MVHSGEYESVGGKPKFLFNGQYYKVHRSTGRPNDRVARAAGMYRCTPGRTKACGRICVPVGRECTTGEKLYDKANRGMDIGTPVRVARARAARATANRGPPNCNPEKSRLCIGKNGGRGACVAHTRYCADDPGNPNRGKRKRRGGGGGGNQPPPVGNTGVNAVIERQLMDNAVRLRQLAVNAPRGIGPQDGGYSRMLRRHTVRTDGNAAWYRRRGLENDADDALRLAMDRARGALRTRVGFRVPDADDGVFGGVQPDCVGSGSNVRGEI